MIYQMIWIMNSNSVIVLLLSLPPFCHCEMALAIVAIPKTKYTHLQVHISLHFLTIQSQYATP